jgi:hypothetical protein
MKTAHSTKTRARQPEANPSASEELTYEDVLRIVGSWPLTLRAALARDILNMPTDEAERAERRRNALAKLRGFLKTDEPPPSDEQVKQWLDERRMEKYG